MKHNFSNLKRKKKPELAKSETELTQFWSGIREALPHLVGYLEEAVMVDDSVLVVQQGEEWVLRVEEHLPLPILLALLLPRSRHRQDLIVNSSTPQASVECWHKLITPLWKTITLFWCFWFYHFQTGYSKKVSGNSKIITGKFIKLLKSVTLSAATLQVIVVLDEPSYWHTSDTTHTWQYSRLEIINKLMTRLGTGIMWLVCWEESSIWLTS